MCSLKVGGTGTALGGRGRGSSEDGDRIELEEEGKREYAAELGESVRDVFVKGVKVPEDAACGEVIGGEGGPNVVVVCMGLGERSVPETGGHVALAESVAG